MKNLLILFTILSSNFLMAKISSPIPEITNILLEISKAPETNAGLNPKSIKVLTWNLHKGQDDDFLKDMAMLTPNKDILMFQEMLLDKKMTDLFLSYKNLGFETATSFFVPPGLNRTGVATGSIVRPTKVSFLRSHALEPVLNSPKVTIITQYPILGSNKLLTVANIHAVNFVTPSQFKSEVDRLCIELKKINGPLILAGDFNTWLDEKVFYLDQVRKELHLKEASFTPDFRIEFKGHVLDHFYYSKDLRLISGKVEGFYMGSDHKPMEVELEYIDQE